MKTVEILVNTDNEDDSLQSVVNDYDYAIVTREGHKFTDKDIFLKELAKEKFFIAGHILDREPIQGYYELHVQCYVIHLPRYKSLGCPKIGQQEFHSPHVQTSPIRSVENYHDDYTPLWVKEGTEEKFYEHKAHGWNILSTAFKNKLPVLVFNKIMRDSKEFNYEINR